MIIGCACTCYIVYNLSTEAVVAQQTPTTAAVCEAQNTHEVTASNALSALAAKDTECTLEVSPAEV